LVGVILIGGVLAADIFCDRLFFRAVSKLIDRSTGYRRKSKRYQSQSMSEDYARFRSKGKDRARLPDA
jgi:hypothetical protein